MVPGAERGLGVRWRRALTAGVPGLESVGSPREETEGDVAASVACASNTLYLNPQLGVSDRDHETRPPEEEEEVLLTAYNE